jgi:hypothetical protein
VRHNQDYRKLWLANLISSFGSQVTFLALPLTAWLDWSPLRHLARLPDLTAEETPEVSETDPVKLG